MSPGTESCVGEGVIVNRKRLDFRQIQYPVLMGLATGLLR